ncbi:MAG TPA: hypothetical protein VF614_04810 [Chthoniobacteraceae bacterium]|jgi:hypothetical protein
MSTERKTRSTAARAIAAYLETQVAAATAAGNLPAAWAPVTIQLLEGRISTDEEGELVLPEKFENLSFPAVVIGCTRAKEHDMGSGYYVIDVTVMTITQIDDDDSPRQHDARAGFVSACFLNQVDPDDLEKESLVIVAEKLSAPPAGEDSRKVQGFHCYGFAGIDEEGNEAQRRVVDSLKLEMHCQAVDG